jgi:predicted ATPase/DNA-binding SARP family transcriptional activator
MIASAQETISAALSIQLFGPMQVLVHGRPLPPLRSRKTLYVLALLTLRHGRPVEREWLAGTLWPDVDQSQSFANLRPVLSALRAALGEEGKRLQSPNRHTLILDLSANADVDVIAFDTAVKEGSLLSLERGVRLYRGPLLEGCTEEWVVQDRLVREQDCLRALEALALAALHARTPAMAAGYWRQAVRLDPLWEAARRGLMEALAESGDSNAALQVYREFIGALQSHDLHALPDVETTRLYHRLREQVRLRASGSAKPIDGEATPAPRVSGTLSHALNELIGREDERFEVATRLRQFRLVTLTGPGGIGKTRLAVVVAGDVVREYPDGVWLVGLETLPASSGYREEAERTVIQQIALTLEIKEEAGRPLLSTVTQSLLRKRLLLVLDNCEHLIESCARVVSHLLRECMGVRILATSREGLRVSSEAVWSVPPLTVPALEHLPSGKVALARMIMGYDAVQLFLERAKAVQRTFEVTSANAHAVALLCSRLEGIPLALELAAARIMVLTPGQILAHLDAQPLDALVARHRNIAARHRTLRATLEWSYSLLPPEAQTLLTCLGVFRGGWTMAAAEAVCPDTNAVEMLTLLRNASLVNAVESGAELRFSLLETVHQFAIELLARSGQEEMIRRRHALFYAEWVKEWEHKYTQFYVSVERENANITAALAWALDVGKEEIVMRLLDDLVGFWDHTGRSGEGRAWIETVVRRVSWDTVDRGENGEGLPAGPLSQRQERFLYAQKSLLYSLGDWEAATESGLRIFESYLCVGNPVGGRTILFNAGIYLVPSDLPRSLEILEQCLPLERESNNGVANPVILSQLAFVHRLAGHPERAAALLLDALELCRGQEESDPHGYARALWVGGRAALADGDFALAQQRLETSAVIAERLADTGLKADSLCSLAALARATGNREWEAIVLAEAIAAAGSEPRLTLRQRLQKERVESLLAAEDIRGATALALETLLLLRGNARSSRLYVYPLLLLLIEAMLAIASEPDRTEQVVRLLGAAHGVSRRLGLIAPDRAERERDMRLRTVLTPALEQEHMARAHALGAAMDDEAALEFAIGELTTNERKSC